MKNIDEICIKSNATIGESLRLIELGAVKIALVVDGQRRLLGTLSDGDIRRGLLANKKLSDSILDIYFRNPITSKCNCSREELMFLCNKYSIDQIPVIDEKDRVVDLYVLNELIRSINHKNKVVLMVGGLGKRLRPLTDDTPKPMLNVGGRPILQTIVERFVNCGFTNMTMCLGYKSDKIQDFFGDGGQFGAEIDYVVEDNRMGTAGALTLINKDLDKPFFVMNGDLLTNVNFENMLDFHEMQNAKATMCVREYDFEVPFGVVTTNNKTITSIEEKPKQSFFVNAGIYLLEPGCIDLIPKNNFYDMTSLFKNIISKGDNVVAFPLSEYWLDIGGKSEYEKAETEFHKIFS